MILFLKIAMNEIIDPSQLLDPRVDSSCLSPILFFSFLLLPGGAIVVGLQHFEQISVLPIFLSEGYAGAASSICRAHTSAHFYPFFAYNSSSIALYSQLILTHAATFLSDFGAPPIWLEGESIVFSCCRLACGIGLPGGMKADQLNS